MRRTAVALLLAVTAGCGTTAAPTAPTPSSEVAAPSVEPVPGLGAEAVRLRTDEAAGGRFQVRVTNTGDEPFTVTAVALDSPGFTALPATPVTAEFPPGRVIDLPTPYGAPACDGAPQPAAARLTVVRSGGAPEPVRAPLAADALELVHAEECAVREVAEVVDIAVTGLADDGDALTGTLTVTRRNGDDAVRVSALGRSVLVDVVAEGLPLELGAREERGSTTVSFTPATCDPHVLSETKKPYVFPVSVQVGEDDPVAVDLPLDQEALDRLVALVQRVCLDA